MRKNFFIIVGLCFFYKIFYFSLSFASSEQKDISLLVQESAKNIANGYESNMPNMYDDPWPVFLPHKDQQKYPQNPNLKLKHFVKLLDNKTVKKHGLIYRLVENGLILPDNVSIEDLTEEFKNLKKKKTVDIKMLPSMQIDADIHYLSRTPIYLYDFFYKSEILCQFLIWRTIKNCEESEVGPNEERITQNKHNFFDLSRLTSLLSYLEQAYQEDEDLDNKEILVKNKKKAAHFQLKIPKMNLKDSCLSLSTRLLSSKRSPLMINENPTQGSNAD